MEKTVAAHHGCIKTAFDAAEPVPADLPSPPLPDEYCDVRGRPRPLVARTRSRYAAVQELVAAGRSLRGISRDLDLDYYTVRRYARADSLDVLLAPAIHRRTLLDAYMPWLYEQFTLGQRNASHLYRQIREQGCGWIAVTGSPLGATPAGRGGLGWPACLPIITHLTSAS
ncbi:hypothetical protein [Micromonospora coerulea]|uniref:hypothetical protein n=1 Tax=Micromonospora coerulea TaxID=47856 RepID=UPI00190654C1|nr:hypothetical protein [Micromonospora veneta]